MGSVPASAPQSTKRWTVQGATGFDSLRFDEVPVAKLGPTEVLVKFHYASLNYRDLIIPMVSLLLWNHRFGIERSEDWRFRG
jgi:hypothetical protein